MNHLSVCEMATSRGISADLDDIDNEGCEGVRPIAVSSYIRVILGLYCDNGKYFGNYYTIGGHCSRERKNGKQHGNLRQYTTIGINSTIPYRPVRHASLLLRLLRWMPLRSACLAVGAARLPAHWMSSFFEAALHMETRRIFFAHV